MAEEQLLRGRQRRYFGYMNNIAHKVDTPESAKSYRSVISPMTRKLKWKYEAEKSFKPDPSGLPRFADKILHRAIKTQIPGLLPALKNSPQFDEYDESLKIYLRSPEFEQHKQRSLHYFWLPRDERAELCGIFQRHLKPTEKRKNKRFVPRGNRTQLTGMAAETAILDQQEYLESIANDPRFSGNKAKALQRRRPSETPSRVFRMNRKFQISYWDPTFDKHLVDSYRRTRSKLPACDAICHEHFETSPEPKDIITCLEEYKKRYNELNDLSGEPILLSDKREKLRRLSLFGTLEDEERRRGFKHIKELKEYDNESEALWTKQAKLMISAAEYINKIKNGRRFPTPPRELHRKGKRTRKTGSDAISARSEASSVNIEEYLSRKPGTAGGGGHHNHHRQKWRKRRHFHHNYKSEEFYMEMYLHFLNPEEDVSLKAPPHQMTDVRELRKKMNLDVDEESERKLLNMLNESSVEALHVHEDTKSSISQSLTSQELLHEKEILENQISRLKNPRLARILTKMLSQINIKSDSITMTSSESKKSPVENVDADVDDDDDQRTSQPATMTDWTLPAKTSAGKPPGTGEQVADIDDEDLDKLGDIPEHELRMIMSEIAVSSKGSGSTDNLSSGSSGGEEEDEGEGEDGGDDDALKLFKKAKRKKDSVAEFMDLTTEFRARVCQKEMGKLTGQLNPFAEAVCILYPEGTDKKGKSSRTKSKFGSRAILT